MVSTYPSEKYELVNGKDDIPYINIYEMGNSKFMFETTNHTYIYICILLKITIFGSQSGNHHLMRETKKTCLLKKIPSHPQKTLRKLTTEALITIQREGVSQCLSLKKIAFLFRGISTETPLPALCSLVLELLRNLKHVI